MTQGTESWIAQAAEKAKQTAGAAQAIGKRGLEGAVRLAKEARAALPGSAADAGRMAGQGVNSAAAGVDAVKTAAGEAAAGFREARAGAPPAAGPGPVDYDIPPKQRGFKSSIPSTTNAAQKYTSGPFPAMEATSAPQGKYGVGNNTDASRGLRGDVARMGGPDLSPPTNATPRAPAAGGLAQDAVSAGQRVNPGGGGTTNTQSPGYRAGLQSGKQARLGGKLGVLGAATELLDTDTQDAINPESDMSVGDRLRQGTRALLRTGGGILGAAGGAALGGGPVSGFIGAIPGGMAGYKAGEAAADWLVGPQRSALRAAAKPATEAEAAATQQTVPSQGQIRTNQGMQTAGQLIDGNAVPESGSGAIRNNSTGATTALTPANRMTTSAAGVNLRGQAQPGGEVPQALQDMAKQGPAGAIASLSAYGAMSRMNKNQADVGLRRDANAIAAQKSAFDIAAKNRDAKMKQDTANRGTMDTELEDYARSKVGDPGLMTNAKDYEATVKGRLSDVRRDLNYSVGNRKDGRKVEDLSGAERQQLLLAKSIKDKVVDARGDIGQKFRDYFGNKQFDSKDLYSYMPTGVEQTMAGGLKVKLANGNTMTLPRAAGGGFNLTGPNDPVDADVMALIKPFVDKKEQRPTGLRNK